MHSSLVTGGSRFPLSQHIMHDPLSHYEHGHHLRMAPSLLSQALPPVLLSLFPGQHSFRKLSPIQVLFIIAGSPKPPSPRSPRSPQPQPDSRREMMRSAKSRASPSRLFLSRCLPSISVVSVIPHLSLFRCGLQRRRKCHSLPRMVLTPRWHLPEPDIELRLTSDFDFSPPLSQFTPPYS